MTWKAYNTAVRIPPLLGNDTEQISTVYVGSGSDDGYFLYYASSSSKWVISKYFGTSFVMSGALSGTLVPKYVNYGNETVYATGTLGDVPTYALWFDVTYVSRWIISPYTPGILPVEYWLPTDPINAPGGAGHYQGSAFYAGTPPALGGTATFQARGYNRGETLDSYEGASVTMTTKYERWESSTLYGEYTAAGGASGTKYCGLPQWKDGSGDTYIRSLTKTNYGKYSYGSISYNATYSKWLIGAYGSASGWWEGSEPSKTSPVTFTFKVPEGSELTGANKTIAFDKYVKGENSETIYLCEAATWKDREMRA